MVFGWKESYSVNVAEIDRQHRKIFEIGARISELAELKGDYDYYDEIMLILEELKDYTVYHFSFEEKLMKQYGYDEYESQQIEHSFFIKKLERILRKDIDAQQNETINEMVMFVADWITAHILKRDMGYSKFFNEKGVV